MSHLLANFRPIASTMLLAPRRTESAKHRMLRLLSLVLLVVLAGWLSTDRTVSAEDPSPIEEAAENPFTPDQLKALLSDLDHDRYVIRENASRQLLRVTPAEFDLLAETADDIKPEPAARAVGVLLAKSRSGDAQVEMAALERLSKLSGWPTQRRAAQQRIDAMEEVVAASEVQRLGGVIQGEENNENGDAVIVKLHLGDDWKGGNDAVLKHVTKLKSLKELTIYYTDIDDETVQELAELPSLYMLQLFGTEVTDQGVAKLQAALPQASIQHRKGALLGVRGAIGVGNLGGAMIDYVEPGTAAADAGLQPDDVITKFNGEQISQFSDLTERMTKFKPGEKAKFTIRREEEVLEVEIEFGRWKLGQFDPR